MELGGFYFIVYYYNEEESMNTNLYIRRTSTPNPLSRAGYAMFVVLSEYNTIRSYGKYIFLF